MRKVEASQLDGVLAAVNARVSDAALSRAGQFLQFVLDVCWYCSKAMQADRVSVKLLSHKAYSAGAVA